MKEIHREGVTRVPARKQPKAGQADQADQEAKRLEQTALQSELQPEPQLEFQARPQPERQYEEGIAELEALVERMEEGTLSLEETLAAYERGMALHARLEAVLSGGERRIRMLQSRDGVPDPQAEDLPFALEEA
jgi:exodeoxyribonuclease VII small subunit